MTRFGVDYSFDPPTVEELLTAGVTFCVRYLSDDPRKNLTPPEAQRLTAAGLDLVVVWQSTKSFMLEGYDAGCRDAAAARLQADACGMPPGRPIYFALDIDPNPLTTAQWAQVEGYLDGAAEVLGQPAVGVYGGWEAIDRLVGGSAAWGWQTSSWSAGRWSPLAHLQQYAHNVALGSGLVDHDRATRDQFGQWKAVEMARAPFAEWRRVPGAEPAITPRTVIFHTGVSTLPAMDAYFRSGRSGGIESHFGVGGPWEGDQYDGVVYQWRSTTEQADANYKANAFAISIETSDGGDPSRPWTPKQLAALVRLGNWLATVHGIPRRKCPAWDQGGFGWHVMFGAPGPWTPMAKVCPGAVRIGQLEHIVLPAIFAGKDLEVDMPLDQNDKDWIAARLEESERRVARYVDHGDAAVAGSGNHHKLVREDLAQLAAQVRDLKAVVDGLVLGRLEGDLEVVVEAAGVAHVASAPPPPPVADVELPPS